MVKPLFVHTLCLLKLPLVNTETTSTKGIPAHSAHMGKSSLLKNRNASTAVRVFLLLYSSKARRITFADNWRRFEVGTSGLILTVGFMYVLSCHIWWFSIGIYGMCFLFAVRYASLGTALRSPLGVCLPVCIASGGRLTGALHRDKVTHKVSMLRCSLGVCLPALLRGRVCPASYRFGDEACKHLFVYPLRGVPCRVQRVPTHSTKRTSVLSSNLVYDLLGSTVGYTVPFVGATLAAHLPGFSLHITGQWLAPVGVVCSNTFPRARPMVFRHIIASVGRLHRQRCMWFPSCFREVFQIGV